MVKVASREVQIRRLTALPGDASTGAGDAILQRQQAHPALVTRLSRESLQPGLAKAKLGMLASENGVLAARVIENLGDTLHHFVACPSCGAEHVLPAPNPGEFAGAAAAAVGTTVATTWIGSRNRALELIANGAVWLNVVRHYVQHSLVTCQNCGYRFLIEFAEQYD